MAGTSELMSIRYKCVVSSDNLQTIQYFEGGIVKISCENGEFVRRRPAYFLEPLEAEQPMKQNQSRPSMVRVEADAEYRGDFRIWFRSRSGTKSNKQRAITS